MSEDNFDQDCGHQKAPIEMNPQEAKAKVLAKWPEADYLFLRTFGRGYIFKSPSQGGTIGEGRDRDEAWLDAARRLG